MGASSAVDADVDRYWLPVGKSYSVTSAGWLADPNSGGILAPNSDVLPTRDLVDMRCIVLLGEPGIGKSSTLALNEDLVPPAQSHCALRFDLGRYSSEERIIRSVFEHEQIEEWRRGNYILSLTLDSFDEANRRIETLDRILIDYLDSWDCKRLFLRIACRTADWPGHLCRELGERFPAVSALELLPLRRDDAATILAVAGMGAEELICAIEAAKIVPLAARPLTLRLLGASIGPDGQFPATTSELFERGLMALADEMNPQRRMPIMVKESSADKLAAASRIAAISVFGGRPTVWLGPPAEAAATDVTTDDCIESYWGDHDRPYSMDAVEGALRSGIFTGGGDNRLTWSHATFADFLAARWLITKRLGDSQIRSLLMSVDGRIHPRVRGVVAWLVSRDAARFGAYIEQDPEAFLGNTDLPDDSLRSELVDAVLLEVRRGNLYDDIRLDFSGLSHSGLAEQLRPALNTGRGEITHVALRIARQCSVVDLLPDLTSLALNEVIENGIRTQAVMAVYELSRAAPSHDLITLARQTPEASDDDYAHQELQAAALMASWPHAISTADVFEMLNPQHPRNFYGIYSIFVDRFARGLTEADLNAACSWILADLSRIEDSRLSSVAQSIIRLCIENLDNPMSRCAIISVAFRRADDYQPILDVAEYGEEKLDLSSEKAHEIALLLFEKANEDQAWQIVDSENGILDEEDFPWLIELFGLTSGIVRNNIGIALNLLLRINNIAHSNLVLELEDSHPAASHFRYWRTPVSLDSPEASEARNLAAQHDARRREIERRRDSDRSDAWVNPKILEEVSKARDGDVDAFWNAARLITVKPGTSRYSDEFQPDLTMHPRWKTLSEEMQSQFIAAAPIYLDHGKCRPDRWLEQDVIYWPAQAGYRALLLLLRENPSKLIQLTPKVWKEWAPILVGWTTSMNGAREDDKSRLLSLALPHARVELESTLLTLVDKAIAHHEHVFLRAEIASLVSPELELKLIERLEGPIDPVTRTSILDSVMNVCGSILSSLLRRWLGDSDRAENANRAYDALLRLLNHELTYSGSELIDLLERDPDFVKSALLSGSSSLNRRVPAFSVEDLASLYIWLNRAFPRAEDPQFDEVHIVESREDVGNWRDSILYAIRNMGTSAAVDEIERIANEMPDEFWLGRVLLDARRAARERSWDPLKPSDLDNLAGSPDSRIVRTDTDLAEAVVNALLEIQSRLQSDTPSSPLLWDTHSRRPKSEEEISDYLAIELNRRLQERGAIVNREVQVRRTKPTGLPERTDIRIETIASSLTGQIVAPTIRIPCEVKGAWNAGIISSVDSQLVRRYMADFQTDYGVYVVAWFDIESWKPEGDGRRATVAKFESIDTLRIALNDEAEKQRERGKEVFIIVLDCSLRRPSA